MVYHFFCPFLIDFNHFHSLLISKQFWNFIAGNQSTDVVEIESFLEITGIAHENDFFLLDTGPMDQLLDIFFPLVDAVIPTGLDLQHFNLVSEDKTDWHIELNLGR